MAASPGRRCPPRRRRSLHTLNALNACAASDFVAALDGVFEHAPWVAQAVAAGRPFTTVAALHEALMDAVRAAPRAERLAFLRGHPDLSSAALAGAGLTAASRAEQTGLGLSTLGGEIAQFEAGTAEYRARFAIPFIVCVARHTAPSVLRALNARLGSEAAAEADVALDEIARITRLRLVSRVTGPGSPRVHGHLSTHVLDTARGRPAPGIGVALWREGALLRETVTDDDGRVSGALLEREPLRMGIYELRFRVGAYFADIAPAAANPPWYDDIPVRFAISEPEGHYHVPLLLSPWSYTTYRGS